MAAQRPQLAWLGLWQQLRQGHWTPWTGVVILVAGLTALPVLVVLSSLLINSSAVWSHLAATVLPLYIRNSLWLMLGVGLGVSVIGVSTAWLVTLCRFPGRKLLEWALLLPLAAPAYLLAYTYTDFLDYFGPVQTLLRHLFGWQSAADYWFPSVRSLGGAVIMFSLTLYPYVYLLARVAFLEQSICMLEASRSLGCGPWRSFWAVALPLARPAIATGVSLALMETLNDFGTVQYFSVPTFTTGIYRTWLNLGDRPAAAQLAAVLLLFILVLILLERGSRRQARYYQTVSRYQVLSAYSLEGSRALAAFLVCSLPIGLGLIVPSVVLLKMTLTRLQTVLTQDFWALAYHSALLAVLTAGIAVAVSLVLAYGLRLQGNPVMRLGVRIASMGYAVPGSVIAVGILLPVTQLDNAISNWLRTTLGISVGLLISGTIIALIFAYWVRFLAVSLGAIESGLEQIRPSLDEASRSLGYTPAQTLQKVHAPLMSGSLLTALMLVFVDVMKELPATLVMRPFNFDTLAIRVYQYAEDERLIEAAAPALAIVLVGLLPVISLSWQIAKSRQRSS
jgi:iron(III) transport system permease protein